MVSTTDQTQLQAITNESIYTSTRVEHIESQMNEMYMSITRQTVSDKHSSKFKFESQQKRKT